jgi:ABC-type multidrug transport system ATPase subunit
VGFLEASALAYRLNDGRQLFDDVSFRVGRGNVAALVGDNGAGKTTLLRILAGEVPALRGTAQVQGGMAVMPQLVGSVRDGRRCGTCCWK